MGSGVWGFRVQDFWDLWGSGFRAIEYGIFWFRVQGLRLTKFHLEGFYVWSAKQGHVANLKP